MNEKPEIRTRSTARETISIEPQGRTTLEEYFMYGETSVTRAVQLYERRAVKAFVTGIASKNLRMNLWERLDEEGWTWQKAREQTHKMMKDRQKKSKK